MVENNEPNNFEECKKQLLENYTYCAQGSVVFILGATGIRANAGDSNMYRSIGFMSLLLIPLTPITLAAGLVCAVANTAWGAVALPIAKIKDNNTREEKNAILKTSEVTSDTIPFEVNSSTKTISKISRGNTKETQISQQPQVSYKKLIHPVKELVVEGSEQRDSELCLRM